MKPTMICRTSLKCEEIYKPEDINLILSWISSDFKTVRTNKKIDFFNIPAGFDIETSSFFRSTGNDDEDEKVAIMYEWTFGIDGYIIIGRTWDEFVKMITRITEVMKTNPTCRLVVYVHNLSYEFQFIRKHFEWYKVFSIDTRKPIYAITSTGIEFRCSYILSGYSLAKLAENLQTFDIRKLTGDLDYSLIRHSKTPLTDTELGYCVNDVKIVMAYIMERIETDGDITRIPMTKTGYVRQYCRNSCFYDGTGNGYKKLRYKEIMNGLRLTPEEYKQLKRAFQGGFTHANPFYTGKVVKDVTSYDFTSSYPSVMISEKFPMSSSEVIKITSAEDLERNLQRYCCLFDVEIEDLQASIFYENYLSVSRCTEVVRGVVNNGRVVSASHLKTTVTEQDYFILRRFYTWGKIKIRNFRRYKKGYLPTDFVKAILKLYRDKTTLKGVEGKEVEYLKSKEMLNSCYGMSVTDIVRDEITYTGDEWGTDPVDDIYKAIRNYNRNTGRFLFYPWGVWVTAYARRNLFTGIVEFADDYLYSDTDSIKVINVENHVEYLTRYNSQVRSRLLKAAEFHGIPPEDIEPKTIKGETKTLGVWDFDGKYSRFKTLGAKRYMVEYAETGKINITVSGLNKKACVPWLMRRYGEKVFDAFSDDLYVPADYTGKNTHTYIDEERNGVIVDYTGIPGVYDELSGVHLEGADYSLSLSREYVDYIKGLQDTEY